MASSTPVPVLLLTRTLGHGGTERQVAGLARNLDRTRFTPHICCHDASGFHVPGLRQAGVSILETPIDSLYGAPARAACRTLGRYLRQHRIPLVHAFDFPMVMFGVPAARWHRTPVVLSSQRCFRDVIPPKYHPILRLAHWLSHGVVTNSEAVRGHLVSDYGVAPDKIRLCYNTIDFSLFPLRRQRPPELASASTVLGVTCVLRAEKRLSLLISAFAALTPSFPKLHLLIVGSGPELESLQHQAAQLAVLDACTFIPSTPNVAPWLQAIDIFVLPSHSEAFSNSLMEAMASGCCPVPSRVGGNPELVHDGVNGLLFEPDNVDSLTAQLTILLGNPALRLQLAAEAAADVRSRFSPEHSIRVMERIYLEFLEKAGPNPRA